MAPAELRPAQLTTYTRNRCDWRQTRLLLWYARTLDLTLRATPKCHQMPTYPQKTHKLAKTLRHTGEGIDLVQCSMPGAETIFILLDLIFDSSKPGHRFSWRGWEVATTPIVQRHSLQFPCEVTEAYHPRAPQHPDDILRAKFPSASSIYVCWWIQGQYLPPSNVLTWTTVRHLLCWHSWPYLRCWMFGQNPHDNKEMGEDSVFQL